MSFEQVVKVNSGSQGCEPLLYPAFLDGVGVGNPVNLIDAFFPKVSKTEFVR